MRRKVKEREKEDQKQQTTGRNVTSKESSQRKPDQSTGQSQQNNSNSQNRNDARKGSSSPIVGYKRRERRGS